MTRGGDISANESLTFNIFRSLNFSPSSLSNVSSRLPAKKTIFRDERARNQCKMIQNDRFTDDIVQFACQATSSHHFVEFKGGGLDVLITDE